MAVKIGPCRIADINGTHEPGTVLYQPSAALVELAAAKTLDPETNLPYCEVFVDAPASAAPKPEKP